MDDALGDLMKGKQGDLLPGDLMLGNPAKLRYSTLNLHSVWRHAAWQPCTSPQEGDPRGYKKQRLRRQSGGREE